jgi:hypothetical protein
MEMQRLGSVNLRGPMDHSKMNAFRNDRPTIDRTKVLGAEGLIDESVNQG